ncbi:MAG TPA: permease-like cell division protein FtsX, partial [Xylella fastidiosa subsp. pauca]
LAAFGLLGLIGVVLRVPLMVLTDSYNSRFALHGLGISEGAMILGGILLLGWLGVWLVTGHFLRQMRPA